MLQMLCKPNEILPLYFTGIRTSLPPMYGRSFSGIRTLPSAWRLFSRKAISIRGGATTVLLRVWARYFLPFSPFTRILRRLACASPRLEQEPTSKYFFWRGDHASTSTDLTFRSATGRLCSARAYQTTSGCLPACRQRSFPASRTGEFCRHRALRYRERLSPCGSTESKMSA